MDQRNQEVSSSRWKIIKFTQRFLEFSALGGSTWETPLLWKQKRLTRGSEACLGEGSQSRSGAGRGLGYQGTRDAQARRQPSFEANAPPILSMAPKKEKVTPNTNSRIWEPSLISAQLNQVSLASQVPSAQAPGAWNSLCWVILPKSHRMSWAGVGGGKRKRGA